MWILLGRFQNWVDHFLRKMLTDSYILVIHLEFIQIQAMSPIAQASQVHQVCGVCPRPATDFVVRSPINITCPIGDRADLSTIPEVKNSVDLLQREVQALQSTLQDHQDIAAVLRADLS